MKKTLTIMLAFAMLIALAACSRGAEDSWKKVQINAGETSWSTTDEKYKSVLESYGGNICTGTMVVATDDAIVYLYCEDAVEKDGTTRVSQNTVFDIASCSKTITAVCILQLAEQGKIDINDTLDRYFPDYEYGKRITIYNLLHMNSGIPDYLNDPDPFWNISGAEAADRRIQSILQDRTTDEELLQALYKAPFKFLPGMQYAYSNTNYRLLAFIIEQISGMKYCDYVQKNIFDKCGMKTTTSMAVGDMTYVPQNFQELAEYGACDADGYPICPNNSRGDGGIHSNLVDMVAFDRALFGGKLLNEKSMETLFTAENGYCCGLYKDKAGYSHTGSSITCSANNKIVESEKFGHIYIIRFEHEGTLDQSGDGDPMAGTNYTKGSFEDGVYTNAYAGLKVKIPSGIAWIPEEENAKMKNESAMSMTDSRDKRRENATVTDAAFWGEGISITFTFLNRKQGAPGDSDYTVEEYMEDHMNLQRRLGEEQGVSLEIGDAETVTIGGAEYFRTKTEYKFIEQTGKAYYYMRKLDDDLILKIEIGGDMRRPIEDYEKSFGEETNENER